MVTDYDCWHPGHEAVTVQEIIANLLKNSENAAQVLLRAIVGMPAKRSCGCGSALAASIITDRAIISPETRKKFELLVGKYLS